MNFNLPKSTEVNRVLSKSKIYENSKISSTVRKEFVELIDKIIWKYKIAENTINLTKTDKIEELLIFNITLKEKEIPKKALKIIDKAIPYAILYVFEYYKDIAYGITIKENTEQRYYFSKWNEEIVFDFTTNTIEELYQNIIKVLIKNKTELPIKNERFETILDKEKQLAILDREIRSLEKKIRLEKQFNKQVAYSTQLKKKIKERALLLK